MKWLTIEHPDISLEVITHRVADELLMLLELTMDAFLGSHLRKVFTTDASYDSAMYRLRKSGLVIEESRNGSVPQLFLSEDARKRFPDYWYPERFWNKKWKRNWYVLSYDVPESERSYRNVLRNYLKRLRLGKLQQSLWITPHDIRASFDDLTRAAAIRDFAVLLQSRTVLGHGDQYLVCHAWPIERLRKLQQRYCKIYTRNIERVLTGAHSPESLLQLVKQEVAAFDAVMIHDPLLPKELYPAPYYGEQVVGLHRTLGRAIQKQLK